MLISCKVHYVDSFSEFCQSAKVTRAKNHQLLGQGGLQALLVRDAKEAIQLESAVKFKPQILYIEKKMDSRACLHEKSDLHGCFKAM